MKKHTKIIIIVISILVVIAIIVASAIVVINMKKKPVPVPVSKMIDGAPPHYLYYMNEVHNDLTSTNVYNEKGEKRKEIEIDLTGIKVDEKVPYEIYPMEVEEKQNITQLKVLFSRIYGMYKNRVVEVSKEKTLKYITSKDEEEIVDFVTVPTNAIVYKTKKGELKYLDLSTVTNPDQKVLVINTYKEENELKTKQYEIIKYDADKDGIYMLANSSKSAGVIARYVPEKKSTIEFKDVSATDLYKGGDWLYYVDKADGKIYRVYKDGTQKSCLTKNKIVYKGYGDVTLNAKNYMGAVKDYFYYIDTEKNNLVVTSVKNQENTVIAENIEHFNFNLNYLYFTKTNEEGTFVMDLEGQNVIKILDKKIKDYVILEYAIPN